MRIEDAQITQGYTDTILALGELPKGWVWTKLGDIVEAVATVSPKMKPDKEFVYIDIASIDNKEQKIVQPKRYLGKDAPSRARQLIRYGDVLFSTVRTYLRNIAVVTELYDSQIASTGFTVIRPHSSVANKLVFYWVQTDALLNQLTQIQRGTSYPAVRDSDVFAQSFPLPPLPEQHRIVAKIEELFTRLDAGVEALKKIKAQLKRYRQSVLKHTFEGKLTAEWRQAHQHELEPASVLLDRIKQERQKTAKGKNKELPPLDTSDLPELPESWVWSNFDELRKAEKNAIKAGPFGSSLKKESYVPHGYKIYGQEQVIRQNPSYGNYYISEQKYVELKSCVVKPGDILISLVGTIGRVLILPEHSETGIINPRLVKLSLEERLVDNKYIKAYIESSAARDFFTLASHGETMEILNLGILRTLPIPVPSPTEQHQIINEIERRFSVADEIEKTVDHSLKQAERLRQSILKRAFEGKLVPQDPNDEPAEKLLNRIKSEKAKSPEKNRQKSLSRTRRR